MLAHITLALKRTPEPLSDPPNDVQAATTKWSSTLIKSVRRLCAGVTARRLSSGLLVEMITLHNQLMTFARSSGTLLVCAPGREDDLENQNGQVRLACSFRPLADWRLCNTSSSSSSSSKGGGCSTSTSGGFCRQQNTGAHTLRFEANVDFFGPNPGFSHN